MKFMEIFQNCEIYTAFPDPNEVFASAIELDNLIPFGILEKKFNGDLHHILLAAPIGDEEGFIGKSNFDETLGEAWLSYSNRGGRWGIDCSPSELYSFHFNRTKFKNDYIDKKSRYDECGYMGTQVGEEGRLALVTLCNEVCDSGNWYSYINKYVHNSLSPVPGDSRNRLVTLYSKDGSEYVYLGYIGSGGGYSLFNSDIMFFYNPKLQRVLVVNDWS